jgi:hypothetical protein
MEPQENKLNEKQSFDLITEMINNAKGNIQSEYVFFLIWGWIVALACLLNYALLKFTTIDHPEIAWSIVIIGFALSFWHGYKIGKNSKVRTYADRVYGQIWLAFLVSYIIVLFFMQQVNYNVNPLILLLAGGSTYLSGMVIKFKPLILGGIALWIFSIVNFLVPGDIQLLISAGAIIIGYLIPGYMLKRKSKEENV